jgi:hypothetical protein
VPKEFGRLDEQQIVVAVSTSFPAREPKRTIFWGAPTGRKRRIIRCHI